MKLLLILSFLMITPVFADESEKEEEKITNCTNDETKNETPQYDATRLNPKHICEQPNRPS